MEGRVFKMMYQKMIQKKMYFTGYGIYKMLYRCDLHGRDKLRP
jgi:hypothetical protein